MDVWAALTEMHCAIDEGITHSSFGAPGRGFTGAERLERCAVCVGAGIEYQEVYNQGDESISNVILLVFDWPAVPVA